jgi:hypothetical protein
MGNIALQRVKGNPAMGSGAMNGITRHHGLAPGDAAGRPA